MATEGNEPAYPVEVEYNEDGIRDNRVSNTVWQKRGISKREYFAAMAMQGLCSTYNAMEHLSVNGGCLDTIDIAKYAVDAADKLIEALNTVNRV